MPVRAEDFHQASITYQCLFRRNAKLSGMTVSCFTCSASTAYPPFHACRRPPPSSHVTLTPRPHPPTHSQGTAATEAAELSEAYGLSVVGVPPHRPSRRADHPMRCFAFEQASALRCEHVWSV